MNKNARRRDHLQNLAIVFLSLSFLLLLVQTPLFGDAGSADFASTVRGWLSGGGSPAAEEEPYSLTTLAVPVRMVQKNEFVRSGVDALTTADDAFETAAAFFGEAIGSAFSISSVSESAFLAALEQSGLYLEFACDLPLEALAARLGVQSPTSRELNVRRCLLSAGDGESAALYLQDPAQGTFRFLTAVSTQLLTEYLAVQDGGSADFAFFLGAEYASFSPYTLLLDSPGVRFELSSANALSDYPSEELLRRAEFNPHTRDRYVESSGTEVVIEGQRKLYLHPDGTLTYSGGAAEPGSLFAVSAADPAHLTRTELCAAARTLLGGLTQGHTGDAALYLSGVVRDEDGATVTFDYMSGGTPIRFADGSHAAEVRVEGQSITAFSLRLRRYTLTDRSSLLLPFSLSRAIAQRYPGCELSIAYIDAYGDTASASWVAD